MSQHSTARLAQSVEHETLNLGVVGSSPTLGDIYFILHFIAFKINFFKKNNVRSGVRTHALIRGPEHSTSILEERNP